MLQIQSIFPLYSIGNQTSPSQPVNKKNKNNTNTHNSHTWNGEQKGTDDNDQGQHFPGPPVSKHPVKLVPQPRQRGFQPAKLKYQHTHNMFLSKRNNLLVGILKKKNITPYDQENANY